MRQGLLASAVLVFILPLICSGCEDAPRISPMLSELQVKPDPVEFGVVPASGQKSLEVSLTNVGEREIYLNDLQLITQQDDFRLQIGEEIKMPSYQIEIGHQVVFALTYQPQDFPEADSCVVEISSTDKDAPVYELNCFGTAVKSILELQPDSIEFGPTRVLASQTKTISITNTASTAQNVTIQSIDLSQDNSVFSVAKIPTMAYQLAVNEALNLDLTYLPDDITDLDQGLLTIITDAQQQEKIEIPLTGSSFAPHIQISPDAIDFGTVEEGVNKSVALDIQNLGNVPLHIESLNLVEDEKQRFSFHPNSLDPIPASGNATVEIGYLAGAWGEDQGRLQIIHDDPTEQPIVVTLKGRSPSPEIEIRPDFVTIQISGDTHSQTASIRIYNLGDKPLQIQKMQFQNETGSFSIDRQPLFPASIVPGNLAEGPFEWVILRFTQYMPTVDDRCTLTFWSDDPEEPTSVVKIIGTYSP